MFAAPTIPKRPSLIRSGLVGFLVMPINRNALWVQIVWAKQVAGDVWVQNRCTTLRVVLPRRARLGESCNRKTPCDLLGSARYGYLGTYKPKNARRFVRSFRRTVSRVFHPAVVVRSDGPGDERQSSVSCIFAALLVSCLLPKGGHCLAESHSQRLAVVVARQEQLARYSFTEKLAHTLVEKQKTSRDDVQVRRYSKLPDGVVIESAPPGSASIETLRPDNSIFFWNDRYDCRLSKVGDRYVLEDFSVDQSWSLNPTWMTDVLVPPASTWLAEKRVVDIDLVTEAWREVLWVNITEPAEQAGRADTRRIAFDRLSGVPLHQLSESIDAGGFARQQFDSI